MEKLNYQKIIMPTAYTSFVADNENFTFPEFAMLCAREFGALISMRDEPLDTPVPERFEPDDFYRKQYEAAKAEYDEVYPQFSYKLNCHPDVWFAESTLSLYEESKPAEPKFKVGDKIRIVKDGVFYGRIGEVTDIDIAGHLVYYKTDRSYEWLKESDLEPYTEPKEDHIVVNNEMVKDFDTILKDGFRGHNRLHIAAMIMASMMQNAKWGNKYSHIARMACAAADTLLNEFKKGGMK